MQVMKSGYSSRRRTALILALFTTASLSACSNSNIPFLNHPSITSAQKQVEGVLKKKDVQKMQVWFVSTVDGEVKVVPVDRTQYGADTVKEAIEELLRGPDEGEIASGMASEIPRGTILLGINQEGKEIEINLSRRFSSGGGPESVEARLEQLSKTVKSAIPDAEVYVDVEGERLTASSIDGIEINQPL